MEARIDDAHAAGRGALTLAVLQSAARLLAVVFLVVAAHAVAPAQFGRYSTAAAILLIVGFVSDLGTTTATTRLVSTGTDSNRLLEDSLAACLGLGLAAWALGEIAVVVAYPRMLAVDFAILGMSLPIDACLTTVIGALDGSGAFGRRAVVSFVRVGLGMALGSVLVVATGSIRWAMVGLVAGPAVALVVALVFARRLDVWRGRVRLNPRRGLPLLLAALPFAAISGMSVITARIDVVVVSVIASPGTTAAYDLAVRILEGPLFVVSLFSGPMLFLFSRRLAAGDTDGAQRAYDRVMHLFFVLGMGISVVLTTLSGPLVTLFFGDSYRRAGPILAIFGAQLWLMFVCGLQGMVLASLSQMRRAIIFIAVVNVVQITFQVLFILVAGPIGGAVAYSFGTLFTLSAGAAFLRRETGLRTIRRPPLGAIVGSAAAAAGALALRQDDVLVSLLVAGVAYGVPVIALGAVGREEVAQVRHLLSRS